MYGYRKTKFLARMNVEKRRTASSLCIKTEKKKPNSIFEKMKKSEFDLKMMTRSQ